MDKWAIIENIAVVLALLYLLLAAYENVWCWLAAGISTFLYIILCYKAELFIETGLQVFYLVMAIVGWRQWKKPTEKNQNTITNISKTTLLYGIIICSLLSIVVAYIFANYTSAKLPWIDAPVTIFSIWATWLVIKKVIENWFFWIVIDAVSIYIYFSRNLKTTAVLYLLYVVLAIAGYLKWKKEQSKYLKLPL